MKTLHRIVASTAFLTLSALTPLQAAETSPGGNPSIGEGSSGVHFFFGVRPWIATWDVPLVHTQLVIPTSGPPPVFRQHVLKAESNATVTPLLTLGARFNNLIVSVTSIPKTGFSSDGYTNDKVKRGEYDVSLGYALTPNILASIVYKRGEIDTLSTDYTTALNGGQAGRATVTGLLLGLNANAPLREKLSLYGNFAFGPAQEKSNLPDGNGRKKWNGSYWIGEVGLSYQLLAPAENTSLGLSSLSLMLGYRAQTVSIKNIGYAIRASSPPFNLIGAENHDVSSTIQGPILGLVGSF